MSAITKKRPLEYLREARMAAGYVSRGTASTAVPFSPETIGRHERGDVEMEPEDAVIYSECYNRPEVLLYYCATCPVGRKMGRKTQELELPHATLRVRRLIEDGQEVADRLEEIAFDGIIDDGERAEFEDALKFLRKLEQSIMDIVLIGLEKEKTAPGATGSGQTRK